MDNAVIIFFVLIVLTLVTLAYKFKKAASVSEDNKKSWLGSLFSLVPLISLCGFFLYLTIALLIPEIFLEYYGEVKETEVSTIEHITITYDNDVKIHSKLPEQLLVLPNTEDIDTISYLDIESNKIEHVEKPSNTKFILTDYGETSLISSVVVFEDGIFGWLYGNYEEVEEVVYISNSYQVH